MVSITDCLGQLYRFRRESTLPRRVERRTVLSVSLDIHRSPSPSPIDPAMGESSAPTILSVPPTSTGGLLSKSVSFASRLCYGRLSTVNIADVHSQLAYRRSLVSPFDSAASSHPPDSSIAAAGIRPI